MNTIDCIYYINLDKRIDRKQDFLTCMADLNVPSEKIERISAIYDKLGCLGCTRSHILALETFLASDHSKCIIFEDDFQYKNKETFWKVIESVIDTQIAIDVLQLSYNHKFCPTIFHIVHDTVYPFIKKVNASLSASSYIITREFAPLLLANFKESSELLSKEGKFNEKYVLDVYWHKLQPFSNWYIVSPAIGYQRASYSDIVKSNQNYGF